MVRRIVNYPNIGRKEFIAKLKPILSPHDLEMVETAYVLSKYGHRNQTRDDSRVRYFEHPKAVAWILVSELKVNDWQTLVMALLHDVLEDSHILSPYRIERNFGKEVVVGLKLLTKQPKTGYLGRLKQYGDNRTILVKLCDRLHNMRTLGGCSREKQKRQVAETKKYFFPLAQKFIGRLPRPERWRGEYIKRELEEWCATYN